jgi:hypothetical protein
VTAGGFGSTAPSFGSSTANPPFGAPPTSSAPSFGAPQSSSIPAFGKPQTTTPSFGTPQTSSGPVFGAPPAAAAQGQNTCQNVGYYLYFNIYFFIF